MSHHPEALAGARRIEARLESPRACYATPRLRPGGLASLDGGSSRRNTVLRLGPLGQPAHLRVIRRRSRLAGRAAGASGAHRLLTTAVPTPWAPPLGAPRVGTPEPGKDVPTSNT